MDNILVIVPTEREAAFFPAHNLSFSVCGVGMAECAATTAYLIAESLMAGSKPDLVVLAGIAGAYEDRPARGETVIVGSETVADLGRIGRDGAFVPLFRKTYIASFTQLGVPTVHGNTVDTAGGPILRPSEAAIENMEGAAFFAVCERFGVRAVEVRTISNRVGEPVTAEDLDLAARRLAEALERIVTNL